MADTPRSRGLFGSLRGLLVGGVSLARTRLELLAVEVQEEKARLLGLLAWGAAAVIFVAAGLVFLAVFLTVLLWESHRLLALGVFTALFLGGGVFALFMAQRLASSGSKLFAASLGELDRDRAALEPRE